MEINEIIVYIMVSIQIPILACIGVFIKKQFSTIQDNHFAHLEKSIEEIDKKLSNIDDRLISLEMIILKGKK